MMTALKLKNKFKQKKKVKCHNEQVTENLESIKELDFEQRDAIPRPPGRHSSDEVRPPERRRTDVPRPPGRKLTDELIRHHFTIPCGKTQTKPAEDEKSVDQRGKRDLSNHTAHHTTLKKTNNHLVQPREKSESFNRESYKPERDHATSKQRLTKPTESQRHNKHTITNQRSSKHTNVFQRLSHTKNHGVSKRSSVNQRSSNTENQRLNKFVSGKERLSRKRTEWQSRSTRYEVNHRLGNIEQSLKDLAISTRVEVYTRLRKIENSLYEITGRREKRCKHTMTDRKRKNDNASNNYTQFKDKRSTMNPKKQLFIRKGHTEISKSGISKGLWKSHAKHKKKKLANKSRRRIKDNQTQKRVKDRPIIRRNKIVPDDDDTESIYKSRPRMRNSDSQVHCAEVKKRLKDMHFCVFEDTTINVKRKPKLKTAIDTTVEGDLCPPDLRGIVILVVNNITTTVVTDWANRSIKSFYTKNNQSCYSQLKLEESPWGLTKLKENMVGVTVPKSQQVMTFEVNPDLVLHSTINTSKKYWGLAVMTSSTLIVGSSKPASLDIIDMEGEVHQSFSGFTSEGHIENPDCIHVTKNGNILLSDSGRKSIVCLTSSSDVIFTCTAASDRPFIYPSGLISTSTGDILLADSAANKVMMLQESGKFVKDVLGSRSDIEKPFGLCVNGDELYIASRCREVQVFSLL